MKLVEQFEQGLDAPIAGDRLYAMDPSADATAGYWRTYVRDWTRSNHVRTATGVAAAAMFTVALAEG